MDAQIDRPVAEVVRWDRLLVNASDGEAQLFLVDECRAELGLIDLADRSPFGRAQSSTVFAILEPLPPTKTAFGSHKEHQVRAGLTGNPWC